MSSDSSCLKVFAVPELVNLVHGYLSRHDLARCTRVCKVFLEAMTPVLWHTVSIKSLRQHQAFTTSPEIQEALSRNCVHIRVIRLQSCKSLGPFLNLDTESWMRLRIHTLEFPWPESIPHKCILSRNGHPVPEQDESLRSLEEGLDLESIVEPREPREPELSAMIQSLAEGHPKAWFQNPSTFLMRQQVQGCNERLHRYLRSKHLETEQYILDAQSWIKKYPPGSRFADKAVLPPPPPLMSNELQFILRITAYSTLTFSLDTHLRKRAMTLLTLQVSLLQEYQQHLDAASASDLILTFGEVQGLIEDDVERNPTTATPGIECMNTQMEMQRQLHMEIQCQRNNGLFQARPELPVNPLQAQICFQLQQQATVVIHQQMAALYDKEQNFHVLQKLIRQSRPQPQCQERGLWRSSASTELPLQLMASLRELLQELSPTRAEDGLKKLADSFEKLTRASSKDEEEYIKLYTLKISQIQGWIASRKVHGQSSQLSCPPTSSLNAEEDEEDEDSPPDSPTFEQVIPRFINSYRVSVADTPDSDIPWHKDGLNDEQLLIQFLKQLPTDSLQVFSSNKFTFRNRALLEFLTSSAERLPGLSCLSLCRRDASAVIRQLMGTPWYQEDVVSVDQFTTEIEWFLHRCPVQLQTLRIAIAGSLEPIHARIAEQRRRAAMNKTPPKLAMTAIQHLYLEGPLALSNHPEFLKRCPDLQSLSLSCSISYPLLNLAPMIVHCPKIEDLAISSPERPDVDMTQSTAALIRGCALSSSSSSSLTYSTGSTVTTLERMGLKRLRLENLLVTQDGILEALQLCAPTLTHLAIRDCQLPLRNLPQLGTEASPSITTFNQILETFTHLQELDVMSIPKYANPQPFQGRNVMLHGKFDAQHLMAFKPLTQCHPGVQKTWACYKTLKVLRIEINGICRAPPPCPRLPDMDTTFASVTTGRSSRAPASFPIAAAIAAAAQRDKEGPDPELIKEGYHLQREICLLLGTFSALEELCLGTLNVPGDERPPALPALSRWRGGSYGAAAGIQTQCLELSLSTGLELMCGMKEMRVLKVGGLEHRIGLGEIQWMCEHWPKLEAVYGLLRVKNREQYNPDWEGKDEDDEMECEMVDWIRKHRPYLRFT
ncbi:unnamed protein product [Mortierella alpina]